MCGPACPVHPNVDRTRVPHVHPVAQKTFGGGFPLHRISAFSEGKARALLRAPDSVPRAYLAIQRDELRRREAQMGWSQPSHAIKDPRRTGGLELDMYSSGRIHQTNQADVEEKWKIGRFLPAVNKNEYGLDRPHRAVAGDANALPAMDSRQVASKENVPAARRQPAAHGPNPSVVNSDGATALAVKDSGYFSSRAENGLARKVRKQFSTRAISGSRYRDAPSLHSDPSQYVDNIELQTFNSVHTPGNRPSTPLPIGPSPRLGKSQSAGALRSQASAPVITPENSPFSRMPNGPSPRPGKSQSAGALRRQASTPLFNLENGPYAGDDREECFTLRHIQRMASSRVRERLQVIEENYRRFKAISKYEQVTTEIFHSIVHLRGLKATLDENNSQHGGSGVGEGLGGFFVFFGGRGNGN